jgi:hypothetical protein
MGKRLHRLSLHRILQQLFRKPSYEQRYGQKKIRYLGRNH